MSTKAPACGWDQATFRCGRCGAQHTATTEADYLKTVGAHGDAHAVWDRLNPIERDGITSILRRRAPGARRPAADGRRRPVSRAAGGAHPHPLTPAELPDGDDWFRGCPDCHLPIQGGGAGLTAHRRTVHTTAGYPRIPITIRLDL
ncbi:hypothetical protein ACPXCP_34275 [Streptomyces sp. DT20]|uniref:hypothetical protein n=1 Tax=Streptomyces sp. DT20 TaxID=3416519 RepID=UPI003CEA89D6